MQNRLSHQVRMCHRSGKPRSLSRRWRCLPSARPSTCRSSRPGTCCRRTPRSSTPSQIRKPERFRRDRSRWLMIRTSTRNRFDFRIQSWGQSCINYIIGLSWGLHSKEVAFLLPTQKPRVRIESRLRRDFFSLLLSLITVLRLSPSSAKQWISPMQLALMSKAKYNKRPNWFGLTNTHHFTL